MEKTTPSGSPFHRWSNGRKKKFQCYIVAFPPPVQGGVGGGSLLKIDFGDSPLYLYLIYHTLPDLRHPFL